MVGGVESVDEMTFTLNSPITEEQWDMIEDVDFDHTDSITFHTKHGKEVEFVKRKTGKWIEIGTITHSYKCSVCGRMLVSITDGKKENRNDHCIMDYRYM